MSPEQPLRDEIQHLAERIFQGNMTAAFRCWALTCVTADQEASEDDLLDHVDLDGSGDLGIDGYWIDESSSRLTLIQSKYSGFEGRALGRGIAQEFRGATQNLLDPEYVRRNGNLRMREAYPDIQECLEDDNYALWLLLVTSRRPSPAANEYAAGEGSAPWSFTVENRMHRKDVSMEILGLSDLSLYKDRLLAAATPTPEVSLTVPLDMYHEIPGRFRACQAVVRAREIAEAYRRHHGAIFRLNIRGPLGSNRVNKEIAKSLENDTYRDNFHLLNNGLSIVCDSFRRTGDSVHVTDFQVVNGCQTTYTLHAYRDRLSDNVWAKVTIIEGSNWAPIIAKSTNTQSTVKAEDFRTLDPVHESIRGKFERLAPPWLYEVKRGESRFATAGEQRRRNVAFAERRLTMRDVAQASLAFLGRPITAKFDLGVIFDLDDEVGSDLYNRIFSEAISAEQLLLPTLITKKVKERVQDVIRAAPTQVVGTSPQEVDWLSYARMHLVSLIAEWLRLNRTIELPGGDTVAQSDAFLSPTEARARIATIGDWFGQAYEAATAAVKYRIDVFIEARGPLTNLREYFRSNDHYRGMKERLTREVERRGTS